MAVISRESSPLKWPEGWERTRIQDRKPHAGWKRPLAFYKAALVKELGRMGAAEVLLTMNEGPDAQRRDPGFAAYFSLQLKEDYSWQSALGLNSPAPTLAEIDEAYKRKAMQYHPDRPGGDAETFSALTRHRENAKAWVLGTQKQEHEYTIPCDKFSELRLNVKAVQLAVHALRQLERVGVPGMLARSFKGFRTALPENVVVPAPEVTA